MLLKTDNIYGDTVTLKNGNIISCDNLNARINTDNPPGYILYGGHKISLSTVKSMKIGDTLCRVENGKLYKHIGGKTIAKYNCLENYSYSTPGFGKLSFPIRHAGKANIQYFSITDNEDATIYKYKYLGNKPLKLKLSEDEDAFKEYKKFIIQRYSSIAMFLSSGILFATGATLGSNPRHLGPAFTMIGSSVAVAVVGLTFSISAKRNEIKAINIINNKNST